MQDFDSMSEQEFREKKRWLFKESIRIETEKKNIEDERKVLDVQKGLLQRQQSKNMLLRKQLENQKILFDKQWQLLETETRRLAIDQQKFNREKVMYKDKVYRDARRNISVSDNVKIMFKGVEDAKSLKKRYKDLLKIYHPDNIHGDNTLLQEINTEYESLTRFYLGT